MQQAVRVLYGTASPSEAISAAPLQLETLDLNAFLTLVAGNAPHAGIADVRYDGTATPVWVGADEHSLEDVVTHVLRNADRYRLADTPVKIQLRTDGAMASVAIPNNGPPIDATLIDRIFEYGVSEANVTAVAGDRRGQGLYVARTYMAKMGGTITALNTAEGVCFELRLPLRTRDRAN